MKRKEPFMTILAGMVLFSFLLYAPLYAQDFDKHYKKLDSLHHANDFEGCLNLEEAILAQVGQREDTLVANTYFYIGYAYSEGYKTDQALNYFEKEKALRQKLLPLDPTGYSNSLYNLMYGYAQNGKIKSAIETGELLLSFDQETYGLESEEYVYSMGELVGFLLQSDQWQRSESKIKNALTALSKSSRFYCLLEAKLGDVYTFSGLYSKAEKCFSAAIPAMLQHYGADSEEYQVTLGNYGSLLMDQGKFDQAEEVLATSVVAIQQSDWEQKEYFYYVALNNLSLVQQSLGQFESAEAGFASILRSDSVILGTDHPDFAVTLSNVGQLYTDEKKFVESEQALQQALAILQNNEETNTIAYAKILNNLARNYLQSGQINRALPLLEQALKIFEVELGKNSVEYATSLFNLGSATLVVNPSLGYAYLKKSVTLRKKLLGKNHPLYAETLEKLSVYQWKKRNKKEVRKLMREVFANYYLQVENFFPVLTEEEKSNLFFNKIRPSQEYYASWVMLEQKENAAELGELYSVALNTKGLILYATDKVRQRIAQSGDSSLINLYEQWQSQKELLAFYYSQNTEAHQLDSLISSSKAIEKELSRRSADFSREIIRPKSKWQDVQKILKQGEAAIEIVRFRKYDVDSTQFSNDVSYAILILTAETKEGPRLVLMDNGNLLENRYLSYYRNGIQFKIDNEYSFGNYWETIHEELKKLNVKTIYLSTDGAFNMISVGSIKNPTTQKYLIEELDIRLVTSTRDLLQPPAKKLSGQSSLLLGFPTYNLSGEASKRSPIGIQKSTMVSRSIRGSLSRFARGENGIAALPGTKKEVEQISLALASHHQPSVLIANDATEANVKKLNNPDILHIATHGYFLEDEISAALRTPNPLLNSGLILAGATNFIQHGVNPLHAEEDGILTAYEAMNLNLDETDLVVLSACETGLGVVQNGEGVYGLQRAFQLAGANYIIMSLWPVDDEATQILMSSFYKKWSENQDVRSAFLQAQLETKKTYPNPFYWGAFILVGK